MHRRTFIAAAAAGATAALAGCVRADPVVVESNAESRLFGPTRFTADVRNDGRSGDVTVELTIYDDGETVLDKREKTVSIDEGSTRRVEFEVDLDREAAKYSVSASAAGPL